MNVRKRNSAIIIRVANSLSVIGIMVMGLILIGATGNKQKLKVFKGQAVKLHNPT